MNLAHSKNSCGPLLSSLGQKFNSFTQSIVKEGYQNLQVCFCSEMLSPVLLLEGFQNRDEKIIMSSRPWPAGIIHWAVDFLRKVILCLPSAYPKDNMAGGFGSQKSFSAERLQWPRILFRILKKSSQPEHISLHSIHVLKASYIQVLSNTSLPRHWRKLYPIVHKGKKSTAISLGKHKGGIKIIYVLPRLARTLCPC